MLKLVGSCAVLAAAAWAGMGMTGILRCRAAVLREFAAAMELMERELSYSATAMPELLELLANRSGAPVSTFFARCRERLDRLEQGGFCLIWRDELAKVDFPIKKEERELLERLGGVLGRYDREGQCSAIARIQLELAQLQQRAEDDQRRLGRVYQATCISAGVLLVILLI